MQSIITPQFQLLYEIDTVSKVLSPMKEEMVTVSTMDGTN